MKYNPDFSTVYKTFPPINFPIKIIFYDWNCYEDIFTSGEVFFL
jgi:hypothetical protein